VGYVGHFSNFSLFPGGFMERAVHKLRWSNKKFKRRVGTTEPVFQAMLAILQTEYDKLHPSGGNPKGLSISDKLLITLKYYREYATMESIADDFNCAKSTVCRSIAWVEDTLSAHERFQLPGKQALQGKDIKTIAVDVTEHPIERPKKQEEWYSGKKKRHTLKSQIIAD
jgi:predicted DNA-binding protein YlxM (UPF0122 family)